MSVIRTLVVSIVVVLVSVNLARSAPSVEMTPLPKEVREDGARRKFVEFRCRRGDGDRIAIDYMPPWPIGGSGTRAFMSPKGSDASATISVLELKKPLDLAEPAALEAWLAEYLPKQVERLRIESASHEVLQINGQSAVELIVTYSLFGRSLKHSILLSRREVSEPTEVFVFELNSKPQEFAELHKVFRKSLYSIVGF